MPETTLIKRKVVSTVCGAPFCIGQKVKVIRRIDDTISSNFIRRKGMVTYFDFTCGCGQSYPNDPMIGVLFPNKAIEEFWHEELIGCSAI